ncbi:MAG: MFS transporter [Candidatus Omnitrophica bacterium]|nr:MFS transporter [Candidatus Omnitrophota bacterium]
MNKKVALYTIFLAVLIDLIGFGLVLPLIPFYASQFDASPVAIGLIFSVYSFAQLIFSPIWGSISDHFGRRPVMLLSTFGVFLAYILFGLAGSVTALFISRLAAGVMAGNISTAQAYVADVTSHEDRAKGMGLIGAAFGIGFLLGPAIAAALIHPSFRNFFHIPYEHRFSVPGFFAAALSLVSFLLVAFKLPETVSKNPSPVRPENENGFRIRLGIFSKQFWKFLFKKHRSGLHFIFPVLAACMFLSSFGQASLYTSFPLFSQSEIGLAAEQVGILFALMGAVGVVMQGGVIRLLVKKFSERVLFFTGTIFMASGMGMIALAHSKNSLLLFLTLMALGWSLILPTLSSMISKEAEPHEIGATMGISQSMGSLGRVLGPVWGGWLYGLAHRLPFLVTGLILLLMVWAGLALTRKKVCP